MPRGVCVDKATTSSLLDPVEGKLVSNDLIAYQAGKGNHHAVTYILLMYIIIMLFFFSYK